MCSSHIQTVSVEFFLNNQMNMTGTGEWRGIAGEVQGVEGICTVCGCIQTVCF